MQTISQKTVFLLFIWLAAMSPLAGQSSETKRDRHVQATLIGEQTHLQPGTPYRLGLLLEHDADWHTYWKSSATGYATSIEWELPEGFSVSEIAWPTPKVYEFQGLTDYVYEGKALLVVTLLPPEDLDADSVDIQFKADWLMCETVCIPGSIESSLTLPVQDADPQPSEQWKSTFAKADKSMPVKTDAYALKAWKGPEGVILEISGDSLPASIYFFDSQAAFVAEPETRFSRPDDTTLRISLPLDPATDQMPERVTGVLKATDGWAAAESAAGIVVDVPVQETAPAASAEPLRISIGILALAFAGGLILNLMPCVFPVLGIKIMGFVGQAGASRGKVIMHGLTFSAGVLLSFWVLATVLLVLRSGGSQIGWGFQLQSPGFVLTLTFILFAFGLNMSGLFEVGQSAVGVGSGLTGKQGLSGSFFSGILATVVATPCAAPFLAPALGAALTLPPASSLLVFTFIGLGLAMPYMVLSTFPGLIDRLPRPGAWMETFKQSMGFLLYATVAYLLWVLAGQLTESGGYPVFSFLKILLSLVALALALWIYGRWGAYHRKKRTRIAGTAVAVAVLIGSLLTGYSGATPVSHDGTAVQWEKWEPGKAEALAAEGKIVYVDFTARWCVTCQTNKATVFSSSKVLDLFKDLEVVALKADWTNQDPEISQALASHGRSAVPFNLVYGPGLEDPRPLPELLTPGIVLNAIEEASAER